MNTQTLSIATEIAVCQFLNNSRAASVGMRQKDLNRLRKLLTYDGNGGGFKLMQDILILTEEEFLGKPGIGNKTLFSFKQLLAPEDLHFSTIKHIGGM